MTLIAIPGDPAANSFVTLAEALPYMVGRPGRDAFVALDEEIQEAYLIQATQTISLQVAWFGTMIAEDQALPLPMHPQKDGFGRLLAEDIIPPLAQQATALYALALAQGGNEPSPQEQGITELQVYGDMSVTYSERMRAVSVRNSLPRDVCMLLRYYGKVPSLGGTIAVFRG